MRYAVYFTPPKDDPLTLAAARWLGRDAFSGEQISVGQIVPGLSETLSAYHTAAPRRYGFHGTIVAPFALASSAGEGELIAAFDAFCAGHRAFTIPAVGLRRLGSFLTLMASEPCAELQELAAAAVIHFDAWRAPLGEDGIARRNPEKLSERQNALLLRWGYPYVMEEFRFHMTLSGSLPADLAEPFEAAARHWFAPFIDAPLAVDGLALFVEPDAGAPFTVMRHARLASV